MQDFKDSTKVIGVAGQGGLGLPDRDYYLKKDPASVKIREEYAQHIARMFELLGDTPDNASRQARYRHGHRDQPRQGFHVAGR